VRDVAAGAEGAALAAKEEGTRGCRGRVLESKQLIARIRDERLSLWESVEIENAAQAALCDTDDYREGFAAFQQKRKAEFMGD
jgi:enoyl-CoA hydratase/carnithine racemase